MKKVIVDNAKLLLFRAQSDFMFDPESDQHPRYIQAFLLQASIIEGLVREFSSMSNKRNRISGLTEPRNFFQSARECRVAGTISENQFDTIKEYIDFRNGIVHTLLSKRSIDNLESDIDMKYNKGLEIIDIFID